MRYLTKIAISFIWTWLFTSIICFGQEKTILLDSLFGTMHDRGQFSGSVLVAEQNQTIYSKSFGFADRENESPLNERTLFNVGSVSKAFTAIAILQLAENDQLNVVDHVINHLPDFAYPNITIHHLLIHAGGFELDHVSLDSLPENKIASNQEFFEILYSLKPPLLFVPGERSEYSNLGYMVLAEIVEKVSGTGFKEYLKKNVFDPANMPRTAIYNAEEIKQIDNVAKGYVLYPFTGKYEEAINIPELAAYVSSGFHGDGNVYSSTLDLINFYKALAKNTLISEEFLKTAFVKHIPAKMEGTPDYGHYYGYGWLVFNTPKQIVYRGGGLQGYASNTFWNITDERVIIYLINDHLSYTSYNDQIPTALAEILNQNQLQIPKMMASVELTKIAPTSTVQELKVKINDIKQNRELYDLDVNGLRFLVHKLQQLGQDEKAKVLMESFKPQ